MAKRRRRKSSNPTKHRTNGTVYMVEIQLGDMVLYKVGATQNSARRRVLGIIDSMEQAYGVFPRCKILHERKCKWYYQAEKEIHHRLDKYMYETRVQFSGSTEVVKCKYEDVLEVYNDVLDNSIEADTDAINEW